MFSKYYLVVFYGLKSISKKEKLIWIIKTRRILVIRVKTSIIAFIRNWIRIQNKTLAPSQNLVIRYILTEQ
jgi:hypothetical protein